MRIILTGYRGSGKSTVGGRLAERLGVPFFDTDALIGERSGQTVRQIVADGGWEAFRLLEHRVIEELPDRPAVIALGGGAVLDQGNVEALKEGGFFVWLTAGADAILERLAADGKTSDQRPPLAGGDDRGKVEKLLRERLPVYRRVADLAIDTSGRSVDEIVAMITEVVDRGLSIRGERPQSGI